MRQFIPTFLFALICTSCKAKTEQFNINKSIEDGLFDDHLLSSEKLPILTVRINRLPSDTGSTLLDFKGRVHKEIGDSLWKKE
jgi:hypothetical protein